MELLQQLLRIGAAETINVPAFSAITVDRYISDFTLTDKNACVRCNELYPDQPPALNCNRVTMNVHPLNPMAVFNLDDWINRFPQKVRQNLPNCDYIFADAENMYASRKIAFCDLSCLKSKYVEPGESKKYPEGKRQYVLKQMTSMAAWLMKNDMVCHYIATATHRSYIFGVRINDFIPEDEAATAMHSFSQTPSSTAQTISSVQTLNNLAFNFVEVNYPTPFVW